MSRTIDQAAASELKQRLTFENMLSSNQYVQQIYAVMDQT